MPDPENGTPSDPLREKRKEDWDSKTSPYLHWWSLHEGRDVIGNASSDIKVIDWSNFAFIPSLYSLAEEIDGGINYQAEGSQLRDQRAESFPNSKVPIPIFALNPRVDDVSTSNDQIGTFPDFAKLTVPKFCVEPDTLPPDDAVIVAVIDSAIALGHQRFCDKAGRTRILSSWQQTAEFRDPSAVTGPDSHLPFGRELRKAEIDALLATHTRGGLLDEDDFNRAAGLTHLGRKRANNEIEYNAAHGTHVLDLAAGANPASLDFDVAAVTRRPILTVSLPDHMTIGVSGIFLEYFVTQAVDWIVQTAERLSDARRALDGKTIEEWQGYPVVINLSYGLHAGPKDSSSYLERSITYQIQRRIQKDLPPLRVVLPIGNDNLQQGNAVWKIHTDSSKQGPEKRTFRWHVLPEDQSSNYLELWSADFERGAPKDALPFKIQLTAPDGRKTGFEAGKHGQTLDAFGCARIYCQKMMDPLSKVHPKRDTKSKNGATKPAKRSNIRQRYLICLAPTLDHEGGNTAPAGEWKIEIGLTDERKFASGLDAFLHVQTDQNATPSDEFGYLSYLESDDYEPFEENGAWRDTYAWDGNEDLAAWQANREPNNPSGPIQRKGTHNSLAALENAVVVAGHRESDGRPALYSATAYGDRRRDGRDAPTFSLPSDSGPAHPGLLAAGSRSSSTAILQGTSFSTALATRLVADELSMWKPADDKDGFRWLNGAGSNRALGVAATAAEKTNGFANRVYTWKSGDGRMAAPRTGRPPRIDS